MIETYILVFRRNGKNNIQHEISKDFANLIVESGTGKIIGGKLVGDNVHITHIEVTVV